MSGFLGERAFDNSPAIYGWEIVLENKIKSRRDERKGKYRGSLDACFTENSPAIYGWEIVHENKIKSRRDERTPW